MYVCIYVYHPSPLGIGVGMRISITWSTQYFVFDNFLGVWAFVCKQEV